MRRPRIGGGGAQILSHTDEVGVEFPTADGSEGGAEGDEPVVLAVVILGPHDAHLGRRSVGVRLLADKVAVEVAADGQRVAVVPDGRQAEAPDVGRAERRVALDVGEVRRADAPRIEVAEVGPLHVAGVLRDEHEEAHRIEGVRRGGVLEEVGVGASHALATGRVCPLRAQSGGEAEATKLEGDRGVAGRDLLGVIVEETRVGGCALAPDRVAHAVAGVLRTGGEPHARPEDAHGGGVDGQHTVARGREVAVRPARCRMLVRLAAEAAVGVVGHELEPRPDRVRAVCHVHGRRGCAIRLLAVVVTRDRPQLAVLTDPGLHLRRLRFSSARKLRLGADGRPRVGVEDRPHAPRDVASPAVRYRLGRERAGCVVHIETLGR